MISINVRADIRRVTRNLRLSRKQIGAMARRAINKAGSADRRKIRDALEQLGPYRGLVRHYERPFSAERHDALSPEQVFMARYDANDILTPIAWGKKLAK